MSIKKREIVSTTAVVEGFRPLMQAIRRLEPTLRKGMQAKLRSVGQIVADEAKATARRKGLYDTGKLVRSIRPKVATQSVAIVAGAMRRSRKYPQGYNYPKRYEYGEGGARAFMRPALEAKQEEVTKRFLEIFDEMQRGWQQ